MSENSQRRWTELVEVAAQIFHDKGYEATSMQDVADALGILKGSLYHYIKNKQDLLLAVAEQAHRASMLALDDVRGMGLDDDPTLELAAFIKTHLMLLLREGVKFRVYLHDMRSLEPAQYALVNERRSEYSHFVQDIIERGQEAGAFKSPVAAHLLALGLLGMLNWTNEWYRADGPASVEELIQAYVEAGLRSVGIGRKNLTRALRATRPERRTPLPLQPTIR